MTPPFWLRALAGANPLGLASNMGTLAQSLPDTPESLALRGAHASAARQGLRDRMSAMPAPGSELGAGLPTLPDAARSTFDWLEQHTNPNVARAAPAPVGNSPKPAPLPMPTPSTDMASLMMPFGPYSGRAAPVIPSSFQPTAAAAPAAPQPDVQTYNFDELNPMDPFTPPGSGSTGSIPMPRPRPASAPLSLPPPMQQMAGFNPFLPNMATPPSTEGMQARAVSDGEGGFMNDFYNKKLFGFL